MRYILPFLVALLAPLAHMPVALAQGGERPMLIRDAETENAVRYFAQPLLKAAGLEPGALRVHLVLDDRLNAFVAGGQRIFVHTGLLRNAENANAIIGVLAHETGHISGGHLAQLNSNLRNASAQVIASLILGVAVAVSTGRADAAIAGATLGQSVAERSFLGYNRAMESSADQAGLAYLESTGQSARGLLSILESLQDQELLNSQGGDPYLRTHPLSQERIATVRNQVEKSRFSDAAVDPNLDIWFRRIRGKLNGYVDPPDRTLAHYAADRTDIEAMYARAYALKKLNRTDDALAIADALIARSPNDMFFHELKGDILWDGGRIPDSLAPYRRAVKLYENSALLRISLARALLEVDGKKTAREALGHLNQATHLEPWIPTAWRMKAKAYGRLGDMGGVALALAEEALLQGDRETAARQADRALQLLADTAENKARRQQALDIKNRAAPAPAPASGG